MGFLVNLSGKRTGHQGTSEKPLLQRVKNLESLKGTLLQQVIEWHRRGKPVILAKLSGL